MRDFRRLLESGAFTHPHAPRVVGPPFEPRSERQRPSNLSLTFKMPEVPMARDERGLIVSSPIKVDGGSAKLDGSSLDPQELRFALLMWDRLEWPINNFIRIEGNDDAVSLVEAGILTRTEAIISGGGSAGEVFRQVFVSTFLERDSRQPGHWSLARGERFLSFSDSELDVGRGILFKLHAAIPVPDRDVPYADVLEFKRRYFSELLSLRFHLEELYQEIQASPDTDLSALSVIAKLDRASTDYLRALKAASIPFRAMDLSVSIDLKDVLVGAWVMQNAHAQGLHSTTAALAGLAGAATSASLSFSIGAGLKQRKPSTPFEY